LCSFESPLQEHPEMKKAFFLTIFFLCHFSGFAQDSKPKDTNDYVLSLIQSVKKSNESNGIKSLSYLKKAMKYEDAIADTLRLQLYEVAGDTYLLQESFYQSLKYYNKKLELETLNKSAGIFHTYNSMGNVYWRLKNKSKAKAYWEKSMEGIKNSDQRILDPERYSAYHNLAVYERDQGNFAESLEMLDEFIKQCIRLKDTGRIVKAYQNVAINNLDLKEYDTAFVYYHRAVRLAKRAGLNYDLGFTYYNLSSYYNKHRINRDSTEYYALKAFKIGDEYKFPYIKKMGSEMLIYHYEVTGNYEKANHYLHVLTLLVEQMSEDESLKKMNQLEEKHLLKMEDQDLLLEAKKKDLLYIALFSIGIIIVLVLSLQRNKLKRRTAENKLLANQLEEKNKELTENAIHMLQTNKIIDTTHKELSELKGVANLPTKKMLSRIIVDLKSGAKGFNKDEFEKLFKETHEDFYKKLLQRYPDLTRNEIRLCAFGKMNLSIKEISAITQQSSNSIVAGRYRLKKKMGLEESDSLSNFLIQF